MFWGSTFLFIRIGVQQVPPLLFAAMRFSIAGAVLVAWSLACRTPLPTPRQFLSLLLLAFLIFVCDYGILFWAEQQVPSGIASLILSTIAAFTALAEVCLLRTQRLTLRLGFSLLLGLCGVAVLMLRTLHLGAPISGIGTAALLFGAITWSISSVLNRKLPLPSSRILSSGLQMLLGSLMLFPAAALFGEFHHFTVASMSHSAWIALLYLVIPGSLIGFTAYIWLIQHHPPTLVGTYAYVNPVIAVILGYLVLGEPLGLRTLLGGACVLVSVIMITTTPKSPVPAALEAEPIEP